MKSNQKKTNNIYSFKIGDILKLNGVLGIITYIDDTYLCIEWDKDPEGQDDEAGPYVIEYHGERSFYSNLNWTLASKLEIALWQLRRNNE